MGTVGTCGLGALQRGDLLFDRLLVLDRAQAFFEGGDADVDRGSFSGRCRRGEGDRGRFIGLIVVGRLIEDRHELVVLLLRDRVELVAVALGAADGQAHPDVHRRVDAILDGGDAKLLVVGAAFGVRHRVAIEGGGDELIARRMAQQIAGELLDREVVERRVGIEGVDHPVAVEPDRAQRIGGVTGRVGVTGQVEPRAGPTLAERRIGEQAIDEPRIGRGTFVVHKFDDFLRTGRQAAEIETEPANQCVAIGCGDGCQSGFIEFRHHEAIHGAGGPASGWLTRGTAGSTGFSNDQWRLYFAPSPTQRVNRSICSFVSEAFASAGGMRSSGVVRRDAADEFAVCRLSGNDGRLAVIELLDRRVAQVEPQAAFAVLFVGPVAGETVLGQDRAAFRGRNRSAAGWPRRKVPSSSRKRGQRGGRSSCRTRGGQSGWDRPPIVTDPPRGLPPNEESKVQSPRSQTEDQQFSTVGLGPSALDLELIQRTLDWFSKVGPDLDDQSELGPFDFVGVDGLVGRIGQRRGADEDRFADGNFDRRRPLERAHVGAVNRRHVVDERSTQRLL